MQIRNSYLQKDLEKLKSTFNVKLENYTKEHEGLNREINRYQTLNRDLVKEVSEKLSPVIRDLKDSKMASISKNDKRNKTRYLSPPPKMNKTTIEFPNISFGSNHKVT